MMPSAQSRPPTRRELLAAGVGTALVGALSACDYFSTNPATGSGRKTREPKGSEAPALARGVKAGDLPPLAERLPKTPMVVEPTQAEGLYGGEWNTALSVEQGAADGYNGAGYVMTYIGYEPLVRWDVKWKDVIPNIAESFEIDGDGREYVFELREGIKWSDGEPFTADDILFAYNDVMNNAELSPEGPPGMYVSGDKPGELEQVDDYTVRFVFAEPNGLFLQNLATPTGLSLVIRPQHYLKQFHANHNPDVDRLVAEKGFSKWLELFMAMADCWENPELPTLHGWIVTIPAGDNTRMVTERNPYYWKTDPSGAQLPYIDKVNFTRYNSVDALLLAVLNSEIEMHGLEFNTLRN